MAVADRPELQAVAGMIDAVATRGARLSSHPLTFGSGRPGRVRELDVNALLAEASAFRPKS